MEKNPKFIGRKILIVDDEVDLLELLAQKLERLGFIVTQAKNGTEGKTQADLHNFDLILSDIRLPGCTGLELLKYVKQVKPVPFILMTGFSEIMEAEGAAKIGADNFLAKPFSQEELDEAIKGIFDNETAPTLALVKIDQLYCKIPIEEFITGSHLDVDIFIRLSEGKYLRAAAKNTHLPIDRVTQYQGRGLGYFYIRKEDFADYCKMNLKISKVINKNEKIANEKKLHVLRHAAESLLQDSYVNGLDEQKFAVAKEIVTMTLGNLGRDASLLSILEVLNSSVNFIYAHGVGVSLYASLIAEQIQWSDTQQKFKVAMAGLLHDIGEKEINPDILEKSRVEMSIEEIKEFESHPIRGRDILCEIPAVPNEVVLVALQHHESCSGTGFPHGLKKDEIHPMARLVAVANRFCEFALRGPKWAPLPPNEALDRMLALDEGEFDLLFLTALMKIFKHPQLKKYEDQLAKETVKKVG